LRELERLKAIEKAMLTSLDQQISLTAPDSRSMAVSGRGSDVVPARQQSRFEPSLHNYGL
jgi:hypothetical protein